MSLLFMKLSPYKRKKPTFKHYGEECIGDYNTQKTKGYIGISSRIRGTRVRVF